MKCEDLEAVLSLDDLDARIDQQAASDHLASCEECAGRWPEVTALVGVAETVVAPDPGHDRLRLAAQSPGPAKRLTKRRRRVFAASIVVLLALGITLGARTNGRPETRIASPASEQPSQQLPCAVDSCSVSRGTTRFDRGRRFESQITYAVWTAPTPKCLKPGGSGS